MLIVGNSHVSVFKYGANLPDAPDEPVRIHWVGALEIDHFFNGHPAARKVRELCAEEKGWKFLMLGNHDVFKMLRLAQTRPESDVLEHFLAQYRQVFTELATGGKFGWLIGVQQTANVPVPGVTPERVKALSKRFLERLSAWCRVRGIAVIDPLDRVMGPDGTPHPEWLMQDGLHLKPTAASFYFEAIRATCGLNVASNEPEDEDFEPLDEVQSFCALMMTELGVPVRTVDRDALQAALIAQIRQKLDERGLDVPLDADTDFVGSGLLDSLDLVEIYTFATEWLRLDLDFDVNLREFDTVRKLSAYLLLRMGIPEDIPGLTQTDFHVSLQGQFQHPDQREAMLQAEARIAAMGAPMAAAMRETLETVTGWPSPYGIMSLWLALDAHREGQLGTALELLDLASHPDLYMPISPARTEHYRQRWSAGLDAAASPGDRSTPIAPTVEIAPASAGSDSDIEVEHRAAPRDYLVSAIVSTYKSERFIRACLEDLEAQTIRDRLEIIVIDSASPQNERAIVEEFRQRYDNITYLRTHEREGVYAAWNRGVRATSGKYLTNANTDDRHRQDAFERMVEVLEARPDAALVYADVYITEVENETFECCTPIGAYQWLDWDRRHLLQTGCFMGPQPMWRRGVHDEYGYFDESFVTSGDYEFWLRISQTHHFHHLKDYLGLYLKSPTSVEHANRDRQAVENSRILDMYLDAARRGDIIRLALPDDPAELMRLHNRKGEELFERGEISAAKSIFEQVALKAPQLLDVRNNLGVAYFHLGDIPKAIMCFEQVLAQEPGHLDAFENLENARATATL